MTDNVATPVAAGTTLATDDVGGVHYQRIKIAFGADGSATDVTTGAGLPVAVTFPSTQAVTLSGAWNITNITGTVSLPTGASTEATVSAMSGKLPASLGAKTGAASLSIVPASDAGMATSAAQATAQTSFTAIAASTAAVEPFATGGSVTPSDSTTLSNVRGIWVGGAGNVVVTTAGGDVTLNGVTAGTLIPVKATKVKATGTTATNISWLG